MSPSPIPDLEGLVAAWWRRDEWQLRHLARNLVLDCPSLSGPAHPDLGTCGDRLATAAEAGLNAIAARTARRLREEERRSSSWDRAWGTVANLLGQEGRRLRRSTAARSVDDPSVGLVRYLDCSSVFQYWLYPGSSSPGSHSPRPDQVRRAIESLLQRPQAFRDWSSRVPVASMGLGPKGSAVWLTSKDPAPHQRPEIVALPDREKALAVVRLLGLPRYHGPKDRRRRVGLIAATCTVDRRNLLVPTVLHALDNPHFFPGFKHEARGRTASLDHQLDAPWQRDVDNSKIPEWVYDDVTLASAQPDLELVGFFED